jgi:hypothetical protein
MKECARLSRFNAWPTVLPVALRNLNHESPEFIRFVNPGDRVAHMSCGFCHQRVYEVRKA